MVTSVTGQHLNGMSNSEVLLFSTEHKGFKCFPKNLEKFFKNLNKINFYFENISMLSRSDLESLGSQLNMFIFYQTPIEVIPVDLFEDTINLDHINLIDNNIKHVERGAFNNLLKLKTLQFDNNPCHSGRAQASRADVFNLIAQIESKCIDEEAFFKYKNQFTTATEVSTTMTTVRNFFNELSTCNKEKSDLKQEIEALNAQKINWQKLIEAKDAKIIEMQFDTQKTKNDLNALNESLLKKLNVIAETLNIVKTSNVAKFNLIDAKLAAIEFKLDSKT